MTENKKIQILLTGANGFIGRHTLRLLVSSGFDVVATDMQSTSLQPNLSRYVQVDLRERSQVLKLLHQSRPDLVVNLGAKTDLIGKNLEDYSANFAGIQHLVDAMEDIPLIHASSRLVFNPHIDEPDDCWDYSPNSYYGESKVKSELIVRNRPRSIIVRPTSIWGPECGPPFGNFLRLLQKGLYFSAQDRHVIKTLGYVENTAFQLKELIEYVLSNNTLIDHPLMLGDADVNLHLWAKDIAKAMGTRQPINIPYPGLRFAALVGDVASKFGLPAPINSARLSNIYNSHTYRLDEVFKIVPNLPWAYHDSITRTVKGLLDHNVQ